MSRNSDATGHVSLTDWVRAHTSKAGNSRDVDIRLSVTAVLSDGDPLILGRLSDLGIAAGEEIEFFGRAPLGEPILIFVRDTVVALRPAEANHFSVREVREPEVRE